MRLEASSSGLKTRKGPFWARERRTAGTVCVNVRFAERSATWVEAATQPRGA
ncbi:hypothetical protein [Streptomyces violaceus]|uniref:hypothetical protein n=1 Tax=Streptomyces violaceus TaxID=1936 RepID=UPI0031E94127